jgi:hypothetical protein
MMSTLRFHLQLGGSRLTKVTVYLSDEDKLRRFREVALDTLHVMRESDGDVGLTSHEPAVSGEAMTCIGPDSAVREVGSERRTG